jgi:NTE family protein
VSSIFTDFEPRFLKKRVQTGLLLKTLAPWNGIRLASPGFARSDLAAEYYDQLLFNDATFGDLMASQARPYLSTDATDSGSGARFEFTQDEFDLIGSDLSQFRVSRAVAASSAFPVVLTPIVLKNYSAQERPPEPEWIANILDDPDASSRLKYVASQARTYRTGRRRYVHLLDGGLSDNLGLRGGLDRAMAHEEYARIPGVPAKLPRRIAIIVVNAHTDADYGWDANEYSLSLGALLGSLTQVTVSHYSFETVELFKEVMARVARENADRRGNVANPDAAKVTTYIVELHFRQTANDSDRRFFNSVRTSLQLPEKSVDRSRAIAARDLAANREFKRLITDLKGESAAPDSNRPALASTGHHGGNRPMNAETKYALRPRKKRDNALEDSLVCDSATALHAPAPSQAVSHPGVEVILENHRHLDSPEDDVQCNPWELAALLVFIALSFVGLFFCGYVIVAKCSGTWPF